MTWPLKTMEPDYGCLLKFTVKCQTSSIATVEDYTFRMLSILTEPCIHAWWSWVCSSCLTNSTFVCVFLSPVCLTHWLPNAASRTTVDQIIWMSEKKTKKKRRKHSYPSSRTQKNIHIMRGRLCFSLYQHKQTHWGSAENLYSLYSTQFDIPAFLSSWIH